MTIMTKMTKPIESNDVILMKAMKQNNDSNNDDEEMTEVAIW